MKLQVRLTNKDGQQQAEVEVTQTPRGVELREAEALLAWAEERGVSRVVYRYPDLSPGVPHTRWFARCNVCRTAVEQSTICQACSQLSRLGLGIGKAEEWEYLAQYAENMSTRWAQLAIEMQARASTARHDPIEIEVLPPVPNDIDKFEQALSKMLSQSSLIGYSSQQLDQFGLDVGIVRSSHGGFIESDDSLRKRIRAYFDAKKQVVHVDMSAALGIKPGQLLLVDGATVQITDVQIQNGHATIKYRAQVPGVIDTVSIGYNVP